MRRRERDGLRRHQYEPLASRDLPRLGGETPWERRARRARRRYQIILALALLAIIGYMSA